MSEPMQVVTMKLDQGRAWRAYADLNLLAISDELDAEGRERAFSEACEQAWSTAVHVA